VETLLGFNKFSGVDFLGRARFGVLLACAAFQARSIAKEKCELG
jgi:hypothetical protein